MTEAKHTPGPWEVLEEESDKQYLRVRGARLGLRYKIANVLSPKYERAPDFEVAESCANARLIAAAPELLAALQRALAVWDLYRESESQALIEARDAAETAIAKATGAQQ